MTDPYPNSSANTIYTHLLSLSNTFADFGDTVTSLSVSTILSTTPDSTMPSFTRPGSIRRRFLRIISFGRYSNGSTDDTESLTRTNEGGRRYSAPDATDRPMYTAQQSYQSSDSAQTTIIHKVAPGAAPFSVFGMRDQHRGRHISDTEFDTPPSLEPTQQPNHPAGTTHPTRCAHPVEPLRPAALLPEDTVRNPTRLRRNKSFMQCNVCKRILEYTQLYCPGCAARTLHHEPGSPEDSYTDSDGHITGPRTLQPRKGRQNEQYGVPSEESSWDTQGLEAGTAEGSWATIAGDVVETVPAKGMQEEGLESTGNFSADVEPHGEMLHETCNYDTRVTIVHHCCCGTSGTQDNAATSCIRLCTPQVRPTTAAVICVGSVPEEHTCKCWKRRIHDRHNCCRLSNVSIVEEAIQGCDCAEGTGGVAIEKKSAWWMRWSRWFCCY
jgi:hypothetical protein